MRCAKMDAGYILLLLFFFYTKNQTVLSLTPCCYSPSRSVCAWAPHPAGPQVPPHGPRPPRRHRVWHPAAVERSNLWLTVPAVEGYQLLQQVSTFIHNQPIGSGCVDLPWWWVCDSNNFVFSWTGRTILESTQSSWSPALFSQLSRGSIPVTNSCPAQLTLQRSTTKRLQRFTADSFSN